jgi:hypothetical protein
MDGDAMMKNAQTGRTSYYKLEKTSAPKIPRGWRRVTGGKVRNGDAKYYPLGGPFGFWFKICEESGWSEDLRPGCVVIRRVKKKVKHG